MLLTKPVAEAIRDGKIDLVFRRWRRPTVKPGGRLRTFVGELSIRAVDVIEPDGVTDADALRAGATSADDLRADLFRERKDSRRGARPDETSQLYRIEVAFAGADTRQGLRQEADLAPADLAALLQRVTALVRAGEVGWALITLALIEQWPGRRAPELAEIQGMDTVPFKASVRRLKELGLTESLPVGYRLSPRGERLLGHSRSVASGGAEGG